MDLASPSSEEDSIWPQQMEQRSSWARRCSSEAKGSLEMMLDDIWREIDSWHLQPFQRVHELFSHPTSAIVLHDTSLVIVN